MNKILCSKALRVILLWLIVVAAWILRRDNFFGCLFFRDENGTVTLALSSLWQHLVDPQTAGPMEANSLLYYSLLHYWLQFCDIIYQYPSVSAYRLSSIICGLISLWAIYALGKYCFNARVGLIAASLTAINGYHLFYSCYLRYHMASLLVAILSTWIFLWASQKSTRGSWFCYLLSTVINILVRLQNIALLPCHWLYLILNCHSKPKAKVIPLLSLMMATAIITVIPLPFIDPQASQRITWYPQINWQLYLGLFCCFTGLKQYLCTFPVIFSLSFFAVALIVASFYVFKELKNTWQKRQALPPSLMIFLWATMPLLVLTAISLIIQPVVIARNCLFIYPAIVILLALGLERIATTRWGTIAVVVASLIFIPAQMRQCQHNVYYEWDEPAGAYCFSDYMDNCCQFPYDHLQPQLLRPCNSHPQRSAGAQLEQDS